jgi:ribosomal protein S12 methylthiotransferase accessory factor YcaO
MDRLLFLGNEARSQARTQLAETICRLPYSRLLNYGITSYRQITNLDVIGIPVWICHRPDAHTISVTAGKNAYDRLACAGSIIEGLEFWAAENPNSEFKLCSHRQLQQNRDSSDLLPLEAYPLARDNVLDEDTPIAW